MCVESEGGQVRGQGECGGEGTGAFMATVSSDQTLKRWNLPGVGVLGDVVGDGEDGCLQLEVFCSARAHEKVDRSGQTAADV